MQGVSAKDFIAKATEKHLKSKSIAKRTAVRLAIAESIEKKYFQSGDRLPTERELVDICGVSLGTIQAALIQLANFDLIERKRGSGTIVKVRDSEEDFGDHVWHFRFHSAASNRPLRIVASRMEMEFTKDRPDLIDLLGASTVYTQIRRRFQMSEDILVFSEMFLHPDTAPELVEKNKNELWVVNIRHYLEEEFGIKTKSATHSISLISPEENPFEVQEPGADIPWFKVTALTSNTKGQPVYVQEIFARSDQCVPTFQGS